MGNGKFSPDAPCTRGDAAVYLWREAGAPSVDDTAIKFTDVPETATYHDAVAWTVSRRLTVGTSATTFSPDDICTRGQIISFIYRANN